MTDKSQRTEKPTPQRKKKAREDGQVPRSADITAWLTVLSFSFIGPMAVGSLRDTFDSLMDRVRAVIENPEPGPAISVMGVAGMGAVKVLAPILLSAMALAIVGGVAQGGLRISPKRFKPKFDHLNVAKGVKRWFSAQSAWTLAKTLMKFAVLGAVAWVTLRDTMDQWAAVGVAPLSASVSAAAGSSMSMVRTAAFVGLGIAALDYLFERRRVSKAIMMSKEEVKREHRQSEGDPMLRGVLRRRQREISQNRMMAAIADADVVIVNPTEIAIALKYEPGIGAPRVVAKGAGAIAARIREEARKHGLPLVADIPLARLLYKKCEIGQAIPIEVYDAVARILAFIMSLRRSGTSVSGLHTRIPVLARR